MSGTEKRCGYVLAVVSAAFLVGCGGEIDGGPPEEVAGALGNAGVRRPPGVPDDFVATPHGWRHRSCVIQVADDESLHDAHIERGDGSRRAFSRCEHPAFDRAGRAVPPALHDPQVNGWVASVSSTSTGPITSLTANWPVPKAPALAAAQTLFFFPGVEPLATADVILQPVLAWNGFGDVAWTIASWACCKDGNVFNSAPVKVAAGDMLTGTLTGSGCSRTAGTCANWSIATRDQKTGKSTSFAATGDGERMDWVFGGAMEVYGIDTCNEYSASANMRFSNIRVRNAAGSFVAPAFSPWSAGSTVSPNCNAAFGSPQTSGTTSSWLLSWTNTP